MGSPKMLLPFRGTTIIENVVDSVKKSQLIDYIVVLGAYRDEIIEATAHSDINYCYNDNYKNGMLSSVKKGLEYVPENYNAAMIILGDQPMISFRVINSMIRRYNDTGKRIIIPLFNGKRGHPVLIDMAFRKEIEESDSENGLKGIISLHNGEIGEFEIDESAVLRDIDTPMDYMRELNQT